MQITPGSAAAGDSTGQTGLPAWAWVLIGLAAAGLLLVAIAGWRRCRGESNRHDPDHLAPPPAPDAPARAPDQPRV